jgi:hypothetical protein
MRRGGIGDPENWGTGRRAGTGSMTSPAKGRALDRDRLRKLLALLGSDHDGEVLNAARRIDALVKAAGASWHGLIPDEAPVPHKSTDADLDRLDQLLASELVADILKIRLRDMRLALKRGRLADCDIRLLRILYRKAVIDGTIIEA